MGTCFNEFGGAGITGMKKKLAKKAQRILKPGICILCFLIPNVSQRSPILSFLHSLLLSYTFLLSQSQAKP
ncbi:hypothetical protein RJT34_25527 [Clitoria ternatea]|uniref:Uncharacterized protein n=1 Tax=Clitoria ternatea TaxID=43366 RepID=A0AAN9IGY0_CLITE